jgi:hypothetical protein
MTTASLSIYPNSLIFDGDIDPGRGVIGKMVNVSATSDFSIVPNTAPQNFTQYYYLYSISTNSSVNITMPDLSLVAEGWVCTIDLISNGNGSIQVFNSLGAQIAAIPAAIPSNTTSGIDGVTAGYGSVELTALSGGWLAANNIPCMGPPFTTMISGESGFPEYKSIGMGNFVSVCDIASGAIINANTTINVPLRWINPNNRFIDDIFYNMLTDTRIQAKKQGNYTGTAIIGVSNSGGANLTNFRVRVLVNNITNIDSMAVVVGNIQNFTNGVYYVEFSVFLNAGDYFEVLVGKSATSAGTNPVVLQSTTLLVQVNGFA